MSDYEEDFSELVKDLERKEAEIAWFKSTIVTILTLAEANLLTNSEAARVCKRALDEHTYVPLKEIPV